MINYSLTNANFKYGISKTSSSTAEGPRDALR